MFFQTALPFFLQRVWPINPFFFFFKSARPPEARGVLALAVGLRTPDDFAIGVRRQGARDLTRGKLALARRVRAGDAGGDWKSATANRRRAGAVVVRRAPFLAENRSEGSFTSSRGRGARAFATSERG